MLYMIILNADQAVADKKIRDWFFNGTRQVFVLAGYAGTGKTALLKHTVLETLHLDDKATASFVTPTGKAATVLIKKGVSACTVHRLIYQVQTIEEEVVVKGKKIKVERLSFRRRETIDKAIRLIVLDEASMVSDDMLQDILNFGVKVLMCGDNAQLPPVEGFNTYLKKPDYTLTQIVRQQKDNPIINLAALAREGKNIPFGSFGDKALVIFRNKFVGERREKLMLGCDQIICGMNKTRAKINDDVRILKGFKRNLPQSGDKLICTLNNWEQFIDGEQRFNLVNGIIGTAIDPHYDRANEIGFMQFKPEFLDENCPEVLPFDYGIFEDGEYKYKHGDTFAKYDDNGEPTDVFTLNRFEYGYCISCHKAQGSEFDNVIIFDESFAFREDANRWLYTAVTRAKKKLILVR